MNRAAISPASTSSNAVAARSPSSARSARARPNSSRAGRGFKRALDEAGIVHDPRLVVDASPSEEAGRQAALQLLNRDVEFDAIFATSDLAALGAMRALHDARIDVPGDVSIVGFDDLAAARLSEPPLTTIAQDARQAGEALVTTLIATIEERDPDSVLLPVRLVVRQTS